MRVTIYLSEELAKKLDDERRKRKKIPTLSAVVREALEFYFSKFSKSKKDKL